MQLLPKRIDWKGVEHFRSYENLVSARISVRTVKFLKAELRSFASCIHKTKLYAPTCIKTAKMSDVKILRITSHYNSQWISVKKILFGCTGQKGNAGIVIIMRYSEL